MVKPRARIMHTGIVGFFHCFSRCVRRAFLCGWDSRTGKSFEHRRKWHQDRLRFLSSIFFVDVCGFAIMENHHHLILRNRPDLAESVTDLEIAHRWLCLRPKRYSSSGQAEEPSQDELDKILMDGDRVSELRQRLASISWFMRYLKEYIARRANTEDDCTGRFWEGRYKCTALLDQAALLSCLAYVDLNPIRARLAKTPESSQFTSAQERILASQARKKLEARQPDGEPDLNLKRAAVKDEWLCPLRDSAGRKGFSKVSLDDYLRLLDWTGRQMVEGKKGAIPNDLEPILERLEIKHEQWLRSSQYFGSLFFRVAGKATSLAEAAVVFGQKWFRGMTAGKELFLNG